MSLSDMATQSISEQYTSKLDEYTRKAACGRQFVLVDRFQDWLRSPVGEDGTHADRLLHRAYSKRHLPGVPMTSDKLKPGDDCCLLVFCILQKIGRGHLIDVFSRKEKIDRLLPISHTDLKAIADDVNDADLLSKFSELQHRFRPARFDLHGRTIWNEDMVVPIYRKNSIKQGGTAQLWQIDIPEEFVGQTLRDVSSGSRFNAGSEEAPDWRYQFALKTFEGKNQKLYANEMDAFFGLVEHEGMVRWLADYEKVDKSSPIPESPAAGIVESKNIKTYNILLEFGEMDLGVYFKNRLPPVLPLEIEAFWRSLFAVADAMKGVHDLKVHVGARTDEYYGWHADIKPDNILFVENRLKKEKDGTTYQENQHKLGHNESTFKLADPGFAKFVKKPQKEPTGVPKQLLSGGTETYGAPEYPGRSEHPVSQAIDIWSLACVFSLAATWIILDQPGVDLFHKMRQRAIEKYIEAQRNQAPSYEQATKVSSGDQFHNGREVLDAVTEWHKYLRSVIRKTDTITCKVLDLVDKEMLLGSPESRIKATDLCSKLAQILAAHPRGEGLQLPERFISLLGEVDEEASYYAASIRRSRSTAQGDLPLSKTDTNSVGKSTFVELPLKTTHRQSIWPDQSLRLQDGKYPEHQELKLQTVPEQVDAAKDTSTTSQVPTGHHRFPSASSTQRPATRSRRSGTAKKHPPQNYFQAREAIEKRKHKQKTNKLHIFSKKEDFRDGLLVSYFRDKRDIIFLVDNAESMEAHWYEATQLLEVLVEKAKGVDRDGMDLRFTTGTTFLDGQDSAREFVKSMHTARPKTLVIERVHTDLRSSLGDIWHDYLGKLKLRHRNTKDVVVIILTDGIWKGMENPEGFVDHIKRFSNQLDALQSIKHRPFSVEFIQFGNDRAATERLRYLDDYLQQTGIPDFIDTEHSTGDVNKMLLGSFVEEYDKDEGDELVLYDSPDSNQYGGERAMSPQSSHRDGGFGVGYIPQGVQHSATGFAYPTCLPSVNG